jgi:hypothetical protein|tara:strand:+ start:1516 stop:1821 length:306 start_codon:yes stop_codon:yes gene_type:complete
MNWRFCQPLFSKSEKPVAFDYFHGGFALTPGWGDPMGVIMVRKPDIGSVESSEILGQEEGIFRCRECQEMSELVSLWVILIPAGELPFLSADLVCRDLSIN